MAAAKKTTAKPTTKQDAGADAAPVNESSSRELADWDEQMKADARLASKMEENTATGQFFSLKAGVLSWNDSPLVNNEMACVVVDSILENVTYDEGYDEDQRSPPVCFAFGRAKGDEEKVIMMPHADVVARGQQINDTCDGCERNKFGTAEKGRGKACSNRRRLALIPIGKLDNNGRFTPEKHAKNVEEASMGFLKLPVMSVKNWSAYVKQLSGATGRPPYGVVTKVKVIPDSKSQFRVTFEALQEIPRDLGPAVLKRVKEAQAAIMQPYNLDGEEEQAPAPKGRGKPAAKGRAPAKKAPRKY